ncbi:MAG: FixH family protein [Caulobacterales bacterium]|nr:FixH family protein [Caulobacterales bacterium]MCA0372495.1 FixH family protein [Pseudomonadota bacterium]
MSNGEAKLTGFHVLMILLAMFGVVFAVNGYFIYMANKTNSGEIGHAYLEGLKFNEKLEARAKQSELGWSMELGFQRGAGGDALFIADVKDRDGKPVTGAIMNGKIGRLVESKDDKNLDFKEIEPGKYSAHLSNLESGKWSFTASAVKDNLPKFETETRLSIR